ncbi:MAG: bifunctional folylpolyglutamate synthase/dihydrofolate synthase [Nitrospirae bacterium]|nr:bifunctional folylpolyglutamate synthase/dihydrofolate synthase [Nitrospirota bacterium]
MSYQETIDYLFGLQKHGIKFGLSNSIQLMGLMGDPQRRFQSVHIAGTNGKGSTAAFLACMLRAAGYRVGLYTSPHLVSFTERIRINGVPVTEERVVGLAERVRARYENVRSAEGGPLTPTFFEVTTAMAFTCFAEERVDIAVVEAGMGGRLDSTNVIAPLVSVITNIDLEHTEYLGTTVGLIASEKAGIIKPGVPVVTGAVQPEVLAVIEQQARLAGSPVFRMPQDFGAEQVATDREQEFDYRGIFARLPRLRIVMLGRHQVGNACMALAAAECIGKAGMKIPETALRAGLADAVWEGRLERVAQRPDIYLDGAHNPASAQVLADALRDLKRSYRRMVLVVGILKDKDYRGILDRLVPLADRVVVTRPHYSRALDTASLAAEISTLHGDVASTECVAEAIDLARRETARDDLIIITGSLYTVGDARAAFRPGEDPGMLRGLKG